MKEITVKFMDHIAKEIEREAHDLGITSEELIRYIVGEHTSHNSSRMASFMFPAPSFAMPSIPEMLEQMSKWRMKEMAKVGALKCQNCTMPLTPEDVDKGICHSCSAPINVAEGLNDEQ